ncbi:MAG: putative peptidoglycan glycosyltransferase FtsW [Minisyncoccia bacterium]
MAGSTRKTGGQTDYFFLAIVFALTVFGLAMLASASSAVGQAQFNDTYYYLKHQMLYGLLVGGIGFLVGYFVPYERWKKFALPLLILSIILLGLVFTHFGSEVNNTDRWLRIGSFQFQPAELVKLVYLLYVAAWLSNAKLKREHDIRGGLVPFLLVSGIIAGLLILQPATSTVAILLGSGLVVYFASGAPKRYLAGIILLAVFVIAAVIYVTPYRRARILGFLNQSADMQGQNYQVNQGLIAIGSGGVWGVGYGRSTTKASLPMAIDDSIFAVIGEELGFVGTAVLIVLFCLFALRLFWDARRTGDRFGQLLLIGFGTVISFQAFVNIAATAGVIPLTGVPLPFISYGGTAFAVFLTMSGIAANVTKGS